LLIGKKGGKQPCWTPIIPPGFTPGKKKKGSGKFVVLAILEKRGRKKGEGEDHFSFDETQRRRRGRRKILIKEGGKKKLSWKKKGTALIRTSISRKGEKERSVEFRVSERGKGGKKRGGRGGRLIH